MIDNQWKYICFKMQFIVISNRSDSKEYACKYLS